MKYQLHSIIQGAINYKHKYIILDNEKKLVYKEYDSLNEKISYGYKTIFANLFEHERGNVSKMNLDKVLGI